MRGRFSPRTPPSARVLPSSASRYVPGPSSAIIAGSRVVARGFSPPDDANLRPATACFRTARGSDRTQNAHRVDSRARAPAAYLDAASSRDAPPRRARVFFFSRHSVSTPRIRDAGLTPTPPHSPHRTTPSVMVTSRVLSPTSSTTPGVVPPSRRCASRARRPSHARANARNPKNTHEQPTHSARVLCVLSFVSPERAPSRARRRPTGPDLTSDPPSLLSPRTVREPHR